MINEASLRMANINASSAGCLFSPFPAASINAFAPANNVVRREKPETPNVDQSLLHCVAIRLLARESVQAIDDRLITLNAELLALHKAFDRSKPRRL